MGSKINRGETTSRERQKSVHDRSQSDYLLQHLLQATKPSCSDLQNHTVQSAKDIRLELWYLTRPFNQLKRAWSKPVYHHHTASFVPCGYDCLSLICFICFNAIQNKEWQLHIPIYFCLVISNTESHLFSSATIGYSLKKKNSLANTAPAGRVYLMWLPHAGRSN